MTTTMVEQRKDARTTLTWPVSVWVPQANRFFNGQSANISKSGAYVKVPMTAPLERGATVELNFPRTPTLAEQKGQFARIKRGTVVRIDRENALEDACIGVGVIFS